MVQLVVIFGRRRSLLKRSIIEKKYGVSIIFPVRKTKLILTSAIDEVGKRILGTWVFFGGLLICTYGMIRMYHMKHKRMLLSYSVHCLFSASIERTRQRKATYRVFENMVDILCRLRMDIFLLQPSGICPLKRLIVSAQILSCPSRPPPRHLPLPLVQTPYQNFKSAREKKTTIIGSSYTLFFSFLFFLFLFVAVSFFPIDLRLSCVCVVIDTTSNIYVVVFLGWQAV